MTQMIEQRRPTDCGVCCLAMALGVPWETIEEAIPEDIVDIVREKGMVDEYIHSILSSLGYINDIDYTKRVWSLNWSTMGFARNMLWGRRCMIQVRSINYQDGYHLIYWDGKELLDPSVGNKYTDFNSLEIMSMWLFNEMGDVWGCK
jgi:hypothetical protein